MGDLVTLQKFKVFGDTLVDIGEERVRQRANAPQQPTMLANIIADHMLGRDEAAIAEKLNANAMRRAQPHKNKKPPTTKIEVLLAAAPKSSNQVYGYHEVPAVPPDTPGPPKKTDELSKMRGYYPRSTAGEVGFHYDFAAAEAADSRDAASLVRNLSLKQAKDPQIAAALAKVRARAIELGKHSGSDGVPRGVVRAKQ